MWDMTWFVLFWLCTIRAVPASPDRLYPLAPRQQGAHCWHGHTMAADPSQWSWTLADQHIDELLEATQSLLRAQEDSSKPFGVEHFRLPTLGPRLAELRRQLLFGRGFELVRALPTAELDADGRQALLGGIGGHLGQVRPQNADGDLVGHVRNVGLDAADPSVRIYQTNQRQTFHTDSCDVVALLCLEEAASGGQSLLVSAATVYNIMLERDPALAALLFEPVATDRRGEVPPGAEPFFVVPVLNWFEDRLTVLYQRQYIESAQRFLKAPRLSAEQAKALDLFDEIAGDETLHLRMDLKPGDLQFVYNHALLHDRTAFVDKPDAPRHLLRLWLSIPGDRQLPPAFADRYGSITVGDRGGIYV